MSNLKQYIGVKLVEACPMSLEAFNFNEGRKVESTGESEGYLVVYPDGYRSWCPKSSFEKANRLTSGMTFGMAVECMREGKKVSRAGWNGKGMFLFLVPGSTFKVNRKPLLGIYPEGKEINYCPHIDMKTADEKVVPWLASQTDVLADDWGIVV